MSDEDDKALFRKLYGNITRIEHDRKNLWKKPPGPKPRQKTVATGDWPEALSPYPEIQIDTGHQTENHTYRAGGIQNTLMQKLKKGKLPIEAVLDLHGMTREMALDALQQYIARCQQQGLKYIQIIHGKGYRSESGKPVLKPAVAHWLRQMGAVLAYCPALPRDGGEGALYVLLKTLR